MGLMPARIDIDIVSQLIQQSRSAETQFLLNIIWSVEGFYDYQKQGCTTRQGTVK